MRPSVFSSVRPWSVFLLSLLAPVTAFAAEPAAEKVIHQAGFEAFAKGTPGDAGANVYVSQRGRVEVINKWDLNDDGYVDLLLSNDHDVVETVDAFIYWGSPRGFHSLLPELWKDYPGSTLTFGLMDAAKGLTRLPAFGGGKSLIVDLNRDGLPDIVFSNYIHNYPGVRSAYVYWGHVDGYSVSRRTELPTIWAKGLAAEDLNGDGYPDLVFANEGAEAGSESISKMRGYESYIYWGSATGFDPQHPTLVNTHGARDVAVADINGDTFPDLIFINSGVKEEDVQVFWGSTKGFSDERSTSIPIPVPTGLRSGDINGDGYADVVVTTAGKPETIGLDVAAGPKSEHFAYVLFGSAKGFDPGKTLKLPSYKARDSCIADLNRDGFVDVVLANGSNGKNAKTDSFIYWGSAAGLSVTNPQRLPTMGATGVTAADVNRDGQIDLLFANSNDGQTYDVQSYIYWGDPKGYAPYLRSVLQGFGAVSVNTSDLNGDGYPDVLLVNQFSGKENGRVNSHIYWGNPHAYYSAASLTKLPGRGSYDTTTADFNNDGYTDVFISNSYIDKSYLYWGSKEGFSPENRTEVPTGSNYGSSAADLNRDGYLDLVLTGKIGGKYWGKIMFGSASGFSEQAMQAFELKGTRASANNIADLNQDGYLDLIFSDGYFGNVNILWGGREGYSESRMWSKFISGGSLELADLNHDGRLDFIFAGGFDPKTKSRNTKTRIYFGSASGLPEDKPSSELEAYQTLEVGIADLNHDGELDLVCSNYMSDSTRELPMFVFWGSKGGHYSDANRLELPAESSAGVQVIDLNRDGYTDIFIHNHLKDGNHVINSYIYWNGPQGFSKDRKTELMSFGPHFSQMTDPGNLYTREMREEYVSGQIEIPAGKRSRTLSWQAQERHETKIKFQIRSATSRDALAKAAWEGPGGAKSYYETSGAALSELPAGHGWMQYRAIFTSSDGGEWPQLIGVDIGLAPKS